MPAMKSKQAGQPTRSSARPSVADAGSTGRRAGSMGVPPVRESRTTLANGTVEGRPPVAVGHGGPSATSVIHCGPGATSTAPTDLFRELLASLTALHERIRGLTALTAEKLAALRTADVNAIEVLARQEAAALESLQILDAERKAVLARLAQQWPNAAAGELKLDEIASRMPEPFSSQIRAKSEGLRSAAGALQQKNRLLATVARTLHSHIRGVFADLANDTQETLVYGRTGQHEKHTAKRWVDAVG